MISFQKIKKLVEKQGGKRISRKAVKKLDKILENKAIEIIKKALRNANFSGRATIKEEDIPEF